jgi:hypothetical protein
VDDFVAHVDRRAEFFQRALDDGDGAVDAGTEAARVGEKDGGRHKLFSGVTGCEHQSIWA